MLRSGRRVLASRQSTGKAAQFLTNSSTSPALFSSSALSASARVGGSSSHSSKSLLVSQQVRHQSSAAQVTAAATDSSAFATAANVNSSTATSTTISYINFNETLTAKNCIARYGHVNVNEIASASFNDDGTVTIVSATAADATNPAGSGSPRMAGAGSSSSSDSESESLLRPAVIRIGGRVVAVRDMGKVAFVTIRSDGELIQLAANVTEEFFPSKKHLKAAITDKLNTGDIIGAEGTVGRTKKGELTVFLRNISVLAPYVCADMTVCPDSRSFVAGEKAAASAAAAATHTADGKAPPSGKKGDKKSAETVAEEEPIDESKLSKSQLKKLKKKQQKAAAEGDATVGEKAAADAASATEEKAQTQSKEAASSSSAVATAVPQKSNAMNDPDLRYRYRFVDLVARPQGLNVFKLRHKVIASLRSFLDAKDFTEVETPMFHTIPCGANARPFMTHHNSNNSDLYLRIAPELYLKQCVVGGLERVYEIGKVFRNEDTDKSHNPEFTSCEFYAAYKNYVDLMGWTEELLRFIAKNTTGSMVIRLPTGNTDESVNGMDAASAAAKFVEVDLSKPFRRVSVLDEIERKTGVMFPPINELNSSFGIAFMAALMLKHDVPPPTVRTPAKFLDKLIDHFITDNTTDPVFVCDHPLFMSPLAKEHEWEQSKNGSVACLINGASNFGSGSSEVSSDANTAASHLQDELAMIYSSSASLTSMSGNSSAASFPLFTQRHGTRGLSERFELFINGMEVCNAYSELCDPNEQLRRFEQQLQAKEQGDDEAMEPDETFLKALQVGLPPTAGWGMGIDRLVMLLSGHSSIRDVILFPLLKPQHDLSNRRRSKTAGFFGFNQNMTLFALSSLEAELKRRGDRAGCEQLLQTKKIVQQTGRNPELHRKQLMVELEKGLAVQREQFWYLHGEEELITTSAPSSSAAANKSNKTSSEDSGNAVWPPTSAGALDALLNAESDAVAVNSGAAVPSDPATTANGNKPRTFVTTASVSSSSSTDTHTTTTTTTTTTTINAHGGPSDGHAQFPSSASSAAGFATGHRHHAMLHGGASAASADNWARWRRMAYRHNPFWKFMIRYCGGGGHQ